MKEERPQTASAQILDGCTVKLRAGVELLRATSRRPSLLVLGERMVRIESRSMGDLLEHLRRPCAYSYLEGFVKEEHRSILDKLLRSLDKGGFVEFSSGYSSSSEPDSFQTELNELIDRAKSASTRENVRFCIHGRGGMTESLSSFLEASDFSVQKLPNLRAADSLSSEPDTTVDVSIVISECAGLAGLDEFAADCLESGRTWLLVRRTGAMLRTGPWFLQEEPGCYFCFRNRLAAAAHNTEDFFDVVRDREKISALATPTDSSADLEKVSAAHVYSEVLRYLSRPMAGRSGGTFREVSLGRRISRSPIPADANSYSFLREPLCVHCRGKSPGSSTCEGHRAGIISAHRRVILGAHDPSVFVWRAEARRLTFRCSTPLVVSFFGFGVSLTKDGAQMAAFGEAIERYGASIYDSKLLRNSTWNQLKASSEAAVDPMRINPLSKEQCASWSDASMPNGSLKPFSRDSNTAWVRGIQLTTEKEMLVPAALVYLPYRHEGVEPFLLESVSTGLALGHERDSVTLSALLEVVERDSASQSWLTKANWPRIKATKLKKFWNIWEDRLKVEDITLHLAILPNEFLIPVVAAIFEHANGGVVIGTAARLSMEEAALKAALEAHQALISWGKLLQEPSMDTNDLRDDFSRIREFGDHAILATDPKLGRQVMSRLVEAKPNAVEKLCSLNRDVYGKDRLQAVVNCLSCQGFSPVAVDITPVDLSDCGFVLVRVVVPGLVPLNASHAMRPLGASRRRARASRVVDFEFDAKDSEIFETSPHPFP